MSKALPYFRWFPADAEIDENYAALNDTELGFYHRCLNRAWVNDGLPSDLDRLAATLRVAREYLDQVWPAVSKCFVLTETVIPRYVNPRQEHERDIAIAKSRKSSDAVTIREAKKSVRSSNDDPAMIERSSNDDPRARARAESESESESKNASHQKNPLPFTNDRWKRDEAYARLVVDYLATGAALIDADFSKAYELCWKTLDFEQRLQRVESLKRHADEYRGEPRFVPHPLKFLETEWERPVKPKARDSPSGGFRKQSTAEAMLDRAADLMRQEEADGRF